MKKNIKLYLSLIALIFFVGSFLATINVNAETTPAPEPEPVAPQDFKSIIDGQLEDIEKETNLPGEIEKPLSPIYTTIRALLGLLALIFVILIIYAGFRWMTSAGSSEAIDDAKKTLKSATIGLIIIFLSYAITAFVFNIVLSSKK